MILNCNVRIKQFMQDNKLKKFIAVYHRKHGRRWKEKLAIEADVSASLIEKAACGGKTRHAYVIAKACGATDKAAVSIQADHDKEIA